MSTSANAEHVASYYAATANPSPERTALAGDIECDVCVVGAGFTGISAALHLAEQGMQVVVLEAARVGFGASGRNGGQIVNSYSRDMDVIEAKYGSETARALGDMAFEGNRIIRERIAQYAIPCDLKDGNLFAACNAKQMQGLIEHKTLWERYGHHELELLEGPALKREVNSERYVGALVDHSGGHLHPLNLVLGEAAAFDISVVRGLAYYTGIVFEAFDRAGKFRAIFGGGRYDNLLAQVGGRPASGVGLGFGDVVIAELLAERVAATPAADGADMHVGFMDEAQRLAALRFAAGLRGDGIRTDMALRPEKAKAFFARADRADAREAAYIGPDDLAGGTVRIKNMRTREERRLPL